MLLENKHHFRRKGLLIAQGALFAAALNICVADMNNRSYQDKKDIHKHDDDDDDDDEDCLPLTSDASAGADTKMLKQQSLVKDDIIALPIKHTPYS
jgi:hypothetical protein